MRRSRLTSRLMSTSLPIAFLLGSVSGTAVAEPMMARNMSTYGLAGGIETPTAEALPDGTLGATLSWSDYGQRNNIVFQAMPRMTAVLRYARVEGIGDGTNDDHIFDRSLDLRFQVLDEAGWRPAVAVGLQDFLGTGIYSGEYIVASKDITPTIRASAGLGWGRIAGNSRWDPLTDGTGGKPNLDDWFSGSPKPFGSVSWQVNDKLSLVAEYSNDEYIPETRESGEEGPGNINLAAYYRFGQSYEVGLYTLGGDTFGAQFSFSLNPRKSPYPSGLEKAPAPVRPRPAPGADPEGWSGQWAQDPTAQPAIQTALGDALAKEGQVLESMALSPNRAEVRIQNKRYIQQAEAIGRTARLMTRALPPSVETLVITSSADGVPTSSVTLNRADVERLENTEAGKIAGAAALGNARPYPGDLVPSPGVYPRFRWNIGPYFDLGLFDPDDPLRYEVGAEADASYELMPGLILSGTLRQRAFGSIDQKGPSKGDGTVNPDREHYTPEEYLADPSLETTRAGVPRVRSDSRMYRSDRPVIPKLTLAWYARPNDTIYTRVTAGYLERAYAGVSAEALWKPVNSPLAIGVEVNRVRKREFEELLGLRDYEVTTGHVSAYYEFAQGYTAQLDVGQYLAGDKGATVSLTREFANGWRIGAFATKTDLSDEQFGEGSFDKGITMSIPISWATGQPSRQRASSTLRSLSRDGGSRLDVDGRLYDKIRDSHSVKLYEGWGRFWR